MSNVPTNLIPTRITGLPEYTGTSTLGYMAYVLEGRTYKVQFATIAAVGAVPSTRVIATGNGLQGGGDLSEDRTISIIPHGVGYSQLDFTGVGAGVYGSAASVPVLTIDATGRVTAAVNTPIDLTNYVPTSRTITAGPGLTGGGQLNGNITISLNPSNSTPLSLGAASAGVGVQAARDDHVHPAVNLTDTSETQGVLPLGRGGTGVALSPVVGAVIYADNDSLNQTVAGNAGQVLMSAGGLGAPYWSTVTGTGTVSYVGASGGTTGLSFTGSPITGAGTFVLGGTLNVANGGTGATTAVGARTNLGAAASGANNDITSMSGITGSISTVDYIDFDLGATVTDAAGRIWFDGQSTLNIGMSANVTGHAMEDNYFYVKASSAITKGQLVMFTGTVGASGTPTAAPASGLGVNDGQLIMGIAAESIALNGFGLIQSFGPLRGFNTSGSPYGQTWADGDLLYYNSAYAGGLTNVQPTAPGIRTPVAAVLTAGSGGSGSVLIRITPGSVLGGTDSNVQITSPSDEQLIQYYAAGGYWRNIAASSVTVGTASFLFGGGANRIPYQTAPGATAFIVAPTSANTFLEWSGTAFQWSANPLGTVTSVDVSGGTTGLTTSGGPITTSGTITLAGTLNVANGGTGATTLTGYVKGNGTSAMTASATVPTSDLSGTVSLTTQVSGVLPIANGGTNSTATATAGGVGYGTGTAHAFTSAGTAGQVLVSNGTSAPTFGGVDGGTF